MNEEDLNFIRELLSKINVSDKDEEIVNNLIKYKLDLNSVLSYLIA